MTPRLGEYLIINRSSFMHLGIYFWCTSLTYFPFLFLKLNPQFINYFHLIIFISKVLFLSNHCLVLFKRHYQIYFYSRFFFAKNSFWLIILESYIYINESLFIHLFIELWKRSIRIGVYYSSN